jgi:hypothetical protein
MKNVPEQFYVIFYGFRFEKTDEFREFFGIFGCGI